MGTVLGSRSSCRTYWLAGLQPAMLSLLPWAYMAPLPLIGSLSGIVDGSLVVAPVAMQAG